jgi:transposase-like protein
MARRTDLYDSTYGHFTQRVLAAVRAETYGEDIGQNSWLTAEEHDRLAAWLRLPRRQGSCRLVRGAAGPLPGRRPGRARPFLLPAGQDAPHGGRDLQHPSMSSGAEETQTVPYSEKFKLRMIQRLSGPDPSSATMLSREVGVPQPTLSRWLRRARSLPPMAKEPNEDAKPTHPRSPKAWSAEEKYRVVLEAATVADVDLGEFLRKRGLHAAQLEEWRRVAAEAAKAALTPGRKRSQEQPRIDPRRVRELERELRRKDQALAEMAALVALKKKLELLWGDEDESTPRKNGP